MNWEVFDYNEQESSITIKKYIGNKDEIKIPPSTKKIIIDYDCFNETKIKKVDLSSVDELKDGAFRNSEIEEVILSSKIKTIPRLCFARCEKLKQINLENIEIIVDFAFVDCRELEKINLQKCIQIGAYGFGNCSKLKSAKLNNVEFLYECAFKGCQIKEITLDKVIHIRRSCFGNSTIEKIEINNNCTIDHDAFENSKIDNILIKKHVSIDNKDYNPKYAYKNNNVYINSKLKNISLDGTRISYEEDMVDLEKKGFNSKQINQILKAYEKNIFLSEISPKINYEILRTIRISYFENIYIWQKIINTLITECISDIDVANKVINTIKKQNTK